MVGGMFVPAGRLSAYTLFNLPTSQLEPVTKTAHGRSKGLVFRAPTTLTGYFLGKAFEAKNMRQKQRPKKETDKSGSHGVYRAEWDEQCETQVSNAEVEHSTTMHSDQANLFDQRQQSSRSLQKIATLASPPQNC